MKTISKPSHLVISSLANRQNLFQILLSPIALHYGIGTYVKLFVRHFWQRWSTEYISSLRWYTKWHYPTRNVQVGDIFIHQDDNMIPTKWQTHTGKDGLVRVVTIKTATGTYKRPMTKIVMPLASDSPPNV